MALQTTTLSCLYSSFRHYYLCHYLPLSAGKDMISRSLLKFKRRRQPDFNTWIDGALEALPGISPSPDTIILRALHHDETIAAPVFPTALDFLGHALADRFGCRYLPSLLCKSHLVRPCKELSRRQRKTELHGIYSLDPATRQMIAPIAPVLSPAIAKPAIPSPADLSASAHPTPQSSDPIASPPFLLIDDILTTGTTMRMIIRPLHRTFPLSPIHIFTLARANYDPNLHEPVPAT